MQGRTAEQQWSVFDDKVKSVIDEFIPYKKFTVQRVCRRRPLWMDDRVMARLRKKRAAFDQWRQTRDGQDYQEYARARNAAKAETRRAMRDYEKEVAKQAKKNPKDFYKFVNSKLKTKTGIGNFRGDDGVEIDSNREKAETFSSFFCQRLY